MSIGTGRGFECSLSARLPGHEESALTQSRRDFLQRSLLTGGLGTLSLLSGSRTWAAVDSAYTISTRASGGHAAAVVIRTIEMPWSELEGGRGWRTKKLFENPATGDRLSVMYMPADSLVAKVRYRDSHEWAYWLSGDFVSNEYSVLRQRIGPFTEFREDMLFNQPIRFREGMFLDRPPYSLHGHESGRLGTRAGASFLIMEEGGRSVVLPGETGCSDEFKSVKEWASPVVIDTASGQPWEEDPSAEGVMVKHLVENEREGFRAVLRRLPHGWRSSQARAFAAPYYYERAHEFNFVLAGDMRLRAWAAPGKPAETFHVTRYNLVERAPTCILGLADGVVSETGCIWLEVTYGEGTSLPSTPIEERIALA